jgi:hypothetical protein
MGKTTDVSEEHEAFFFSGMSLKKNVQKHIELVKITDVSEELPDLLFCTER